MHAHKINIILYLSFTRAGITSRVKLEYSKRVTQYIIINLTNCAVTVIDCSYTVFILKM